MFLYISCTEWLSAWLRSQADIASQHLKAEEMDGDGQMTEIEAQWEDHGPNWDLLNR